MARVTYFGGVVHRVGRFTNIDHRVGLLICVKMFPQSICKLICSHVYLILDVTKILFFDTTVLDPFCCDGLIGKD